MAHRIKTETRRERGWLDEAIRKIEADFNRSADTHLFRVDLPALRGIDIYLKDESIHPTGSLKHRLARSLFLYGICNGWIHRDTPIIEASSGSTAVSEAYFAQLLDLPFTAVVPRCTSREKIEKIRFYGGQTHLVDDPTTVYAESARLAQVMNGHFMDQFLYAERATDWRGNNNIAESIFSQLRHERFPIPSYIVCGAGTGGTSATLGRYVRYRRLETEICVVDPDNSVFAEYHRTGDRDLHLEKGSIIEGIGRPRVEASFIRETVDRMLHVPDSASMGAMRLLEDIVGKKCGGSTGTNFYGVMQVACEMLKRKQEGSIVSLICDSGERYLGTYYHDAWLQEHGLNPKPYYQQLQHFLNHRKWAPVIEGPGPVSHPRPPRPPIAAPTHGIPGHTHH